MSSVKKARRVQSAPGRLVGLGWLFGAARRVGTNHLLDVFRGHVAKGSLVFHMPDGECRRIDGAEAGAEAEVYVHNWRGVKRLLTGGSLGLARGYIDQDWSTPDLVGVMEFGAANAESLRERLLARRWMQALHRLLHLWRRNSRAGSRRNIAFHYDLGNDFYGQWLDPTMTYSSAVWENGANSLEAAQKQKYRKLLDTLDVKAGDHILEIGCGWGGFAETAARERGARVTGITLSKEQLAFALNRIETAGLSDLVSLELRDYRDLTTPAGRPYDHIVSIEMFEAVGEKHWRDYFAKIHDMLKPGGAAALQIITINDKLFEDYRRAADFIQTYIFPGGMLPSLSVLKREAARAGLGWERAEGFGRHYARTLNTWRHRFEEAWAKKSLPPGFDDVFRRIWTYYLSYCEGGFRAGSIDVHQLTIRKSA